MTIYSQAHDLVSLLNELKFNRMKLLAIRNQIVDI